MNGFFSDWGFHFLRPFWFLAIIPLAFVIWRMTKQRMSQRSWEGVIDEALLPHVLIGKEGRAKTWPKMLVGLMGLLSIIALAGPVWEKLPQPVFRNNSALVIALDLSRSMDAADLKPSRLIRARFKIADLLKQRKDGQTALLVFAADAYVVTPLTDDADTILSQLKVLTTDLMPQQGSRADRAMRKASELLTQGGSINGDILLITDGLKSDRDSVVAAEMQQSDFRVMVYGIGTKEGAPIPDTRGGFFKDASGNIVLPALKENTLQTVAKAGGGIYQKYSSTDKDIARLSLQLDQKLDMNQTRETEMKSDQWREEGVWILLLIIPFAAFAFRKGYLFILIFSLTGFSYSPDSMAEGSLKKYLWKRPDQKAQALLQEGNAEQAAEVFDDQRWKGSAQFKAGDYEGALKTWEGFDDVEALYNKGNAQAKMGKLEDALKSYEQTLGKDPDHDDAKNNRDQVKKALEEQQKNEQEKQGDQEGDQEGDQNKKSEEGDENKNGEGDQSESKGKSEGQSENDQDEKSSDKDDQSEQENKPEDGQEGEQQSAGKDAGGEQGNEKQEETLPQGEQTDTELSDETKQAMEAALRAIPDDPGGLLRRKFIYQYREQGGSNNDEDQQW